MSDNVDLASLAGTCAADDVAGVLYQRVKLAQGADGSATDVSSAAPLQVTLANSAAIPAGTNAIGKLAANSGVDIGDVDITSVIAGTGATNLGKAVDSALGATDTGVAALVVRDDALTTLTPADGDYTNLRVTSTGQLHVKSDVTLGGGASDSTTTRITIDTGQLGTLGQTTMSASVPVTIASDQTRLLGNAKPSVSDLTLSLDTSIYASGDVLADTQQLDAFFRYSDGTAILDAVTVVDKDDQGAAFYIYLFNSNVSLGTENSGPSISDANAAFIQGIITIATGDYQDLGGVKVAHVNGLGIPIKAVSGTDDLYVGVVNGAGTPTYTASGVVLRLHARLD